MSREPRAFFALDLGAATTSASLIGFIADRWRLIAHSSAPAATDVQVLLVKLVERALAADPDLLANVSGGAARRATSTDAAHAVESWPRVEARTARPPQLAVLAGSRRQGRGLEETAARAGWRVVGGSADEADPLELSALALSLDTDALLIGADASPGGDERRHLPQLVAIALAASRRRPELRVILAGGAAAHAAAFLASGMTRREAHPAATLGLPDLRRMAEAEPHAGAERTGEALDEDAAAGEVDVWERLVAGEGPAGEEPAGEEPAGEEMAGESARRDAAPGDASAPRIAAETNAAEATAGAETRAPNAGGIAADRSAGSREAAGEAAAAAEASAPAGTAAAAVESGAPDHVEDRSRVAAGRGDGRGDGRGELVIAPDPESGTPRGSALQLVLESLSTGRHDSRAGIARSIASLAYVLDRTIEGVEVGMQGGLRCRAEPLPGDGRRRVASSHAILETGALLPADLSPAVLDAVHSWSTIPLDRYRLADRLLDVRAVPWADVDGDGALLRLAAARAAIERMVAATPELSARPAPDLIVAAGGVWSAVPAPVVALALADLDRRSGASQLALDASRLLGPLGSIDDEQERRAVLADLADDLLVPLGSVLLPSGLRPGRTAGHLRVRSGTAVAEVELQPGGIEIVDLPPGQEAVAELDFRDTVRLGVRGRRFAIDVTGGLGGLLVDLRDIPLRLPERPEARRELLEAWQRALWAGLEP